MIDMATMPTETQRGPQIVISTPESVFPMQFEGLESAAKDYIVQGKPLSDLATTVQLFQRLDKNYDGFITAAEFSELLTTTLVELENQALLKQQYALVEQAKNAATTTTGAPNSRQLQTGNVAAHQVQALSPDECMKLTVPEFYCSISVTCMSSCAGCGWKSVEDREFYICVAPSATSCATL